MKLLEEKVGNTIQDVGIGGSFLNRTPITQSKINNQQMEFHEIKTLQYSKGNDQLYEEPAPEWENISASSSYNRGSVMRVYKELKKLNILKTNNAIRKRAVGLHRESQRRNATGNKYFQKFPTSLAIRKHEKSF